MEYIFTAIFTPNEDGTKVYAKVPDLPGCITSGRDLADAMDLITDAASLWLVAAEDEGEPIPEATAQHKLSREDRAIVSMIRVDTIAYRALTDTKAVRKNVSLPAWMVTLADRHGLNCSQILQEALRKQFSVL